MSEELTLLVVGNSRDGMSEGGCVRAAGSHQDALSGWHTCSREPGGIHSAEKLADLVTRIEASTTMSSLTLNGLLSPAQQTQVVNQQSIGAFKR